MKDFLDLFLHLDDKLVEIVKNYNTWTYLILFAIIFAETGLVIMPFLPGDSLLFMAGAIAARPDGGLNIVVLIAVLIVAAILGDTVNYHLGKTLGSKASGSRFLKQEHLDRTNAFFEKHGGKTIILARFVPIVRTFAPFVAGMGSMSYGKFLSYNILGGIIWVLVCTGAGFFFGNIPIVKKNFELAIFAIIFLSIVPPIIEMILHKRSAHKPVTEAK